MCSPVTCVSRMFSTNCEVETKPFPCVVCLLVLQLRLFEIFHLKGRVGGFDSHVPKVLKRGCDGSQAMDLTVHAAAYNLGVRKSQIKLPWEKDPINPVFFKRPRLIPAPTFAPEVRVVEDTVSLPKEEAQGRISWSKKASLIPWPVAQNRALARALESWRLILMDNLDASLVGRQILKSLQGLEGAPSVEQTVADALAGKSLSTLRARASSLMAFWTLEKEFGSSCNNFSNFGGASICLCSGAERTECTTNKAWEIRGVYHLCSSHAWSGCGQLHVLPQGERGCCGALGLAQ